MRTVSAFVDQQAAERLLATRGTQAAKVDDAIRRGRPLDAEDDPKRKLAFIQRKLRVGEYTAARIAAYEDPKRLGLTAEQEAGAESLQGETVDFVGISFLDVGRAASHSVARVATGLPSGPASWSRLASSSRITTSSARQMKRAGWCSNSTTSWTPTAARSRSRGFVWTRRPCSSLTTPTISTTP